MQNQLQETSSYGPTKSPKAKFAANASCRPNYRQVRCCPARQSLPKRRQNDRPCQLQRTPRVQCHNGSQKLLSVLHDRTAVGQKSNETMSLEQNLPGKYRRGQKSPCDQLGRTASFSLSHS